ncbi:transglutaminase family protein [Paenirhodobacter populi]|uniref:transglutaminase family protein n=1 Tax=Paenirhodobacter populi TaxID=2306993 RepID=UPI000FE2C249|nr:transglutaminase family protein [Sinirhodobacter populi]RWR10799.1 transglutaminase family protein [Sinirhodobacter populi]
MLYDIRLLIEYSYAVSSDHLRNLVRLLPCDIPGRQRVLSRHLTVEPAADERRDALDFFGNAMTTVAWHAPIDSVALQLMARVERRAVPQRLDLSPPVELLEEDIASVQTLGPEAPHHYRGASPRIRPFPEATAYARALIRPGMTALQGVEAVGRALNRDMKFDSKATTVETPPAEAFAKRRGVCQDFTQIMIAALRGVGIPAGYVSGFLRTFPPPGQPRLEGADAMHAWVRAWVGKEIGWIEFDPTNDQYAGLDYVTVAYGRDYSDVAPVRGVMRTAGGHESRQAVDVIPLDDEEQLAPAQGSE